VASLNSKCTSGDLHGPTGTGISAKEGRLYLGTSARPDKLRTVGQATKGSG